MTTENLVLLSTEHCTLCERALDLLFSMPELRGRSLQVVDVADHDGLLMRFGDRIPVLLASGRELGWPFSAADVARWLDTGPGDA